MILLIFQGKLPKIWHDTCTLKKLMCFIHYCRTFCWRDLWKNMISRSHHCVTGGVIRGMLPQNVSPPKWGDAAHRDHPMEPTGEGGLAFCLSFQAVWNLWRLRMTSLKWFWISMCCLRYNASRSRVLWLTVDNNAISIKVQAVDNFDNVHRWFSKISSFQELLTACNGVFFNHHIIQVLLTSGTNKAD